MSIGTSTCQCMRIFGFGCQVLENQESVISIISLLASSLSWSITVSYTGQYKQLSTRWCHTRYDNASSRNTIMVVPCAPADAMRLPTSLFSWGIVLVHDPVKLLYFNSIVLCHRVKKMNMNEICDMRIRFWERMFMRRMCPKP